QVSIYLRCKKLKTYSIHFEITEQAPRLIYLYAAVQDNIIGTTMKSYNFRISRKSFRVAIISLLLVGCLINQVNAGKKKDYQKEVHILGQHPPTYLCPEGFELQDKLCVLTLTSPLDKSCSAGHAVGDKCLTYDDPVYVCPDGYIPFDNFDDYKKKGKTTMNFGPYQQCMKINRVMHDEICLDGSVPQGKGCPVKESVPVVMICPLDNGKSSKYQSMDCVSYDTVEPTLSCTSGFNLEGGMCAGKQSTPCITGDSKGKHTYHGHHGVFRNLGSSHHGGHHHSKDKDKDKKEYNPIQVELCETRIEIAPNTFCPPGTVLTSHREKGHHNGGKHHKGKDDAISCVTATQVPLQPYCPLPNGVMDASGFTCSVLNYDNPQKRCPTGYEQCEGKGKDKYGFSCCSVTYAQPNPVCYDNSDLVSGQCVTDHPFVFTCQSGTVRQGDVCVTTETAPVKVQYAVKLETIGKGPFPEKEKKTHGGHGGHFSHHHW
ncbi:hypothetical protein IE077_003963, partial [Cardiosporidium cionae]